MQPRLEPDKNSTKTSQITNVDPEEIPQATKVVAPDLVDQVLEVTEAAAANPVEQPEQKEQDKSSVENDKEVAIALEQIAIAEAIAQEKRDEEKRSTPESERPTFHPDIVEARKAILLCQNVYLQATGYNEWLKVLNESYAYMRTLFHALGNEEAKLLVSGFMVKLNKELKKVEDEYAKEMETMANEFFKDVEPPPSVSDLAADLQEVADKMARIQGALSGEEQQDPGLQFLNFIKAVACESFPETVMSPVEIAEGTRSLQNIQRNEAFWQCICDGFMKGHGVAFLEKLQKYKVYDVLFPYMDKEDKEQNESSDRWFRQKLSEMDRVFDAKAEESEKHPSMLAALLIAKELSTYSEKDREKKMIHSIYKILVPFDAALDLWIKIFYEQKKASQGKPTPALFQPANALQVAPPPVAAPVAPNSVMTPTHP